MGRKHSGRDQKVKSCASIVNCNKESSWRLRVTGFFLGMEEWVSVGNAILGESTRLLEEGDEVVDASREVEEGGEWHVLEERVVCCEAVAVSDDVVTGLEYWGCQVI